MVNLGPFGNLRILHLDKIADLDVLGQFRARAQAGIGANHRTAAHMAAFKVGKGADRGAAFDRDLGAEYHIGFDHRVTPDHGVMGEIDGVRGLQCHAICQHFGAARGLERPLGHSQFSARIDPHRFGRVTAHNRGGQPARTGDFDDIGQVVFTGGIVVLDGRNQIKQRRGICRDNTTVTKGYGAFLI